MNGLFHGFLQDLRYGTRTLAKHPAFAMVAIFTLALGIGANTAVFHVLDSVLLRALPVPRSEELVLLTDPEWHGHSYGSDSGTRSLLAYWEFQYLHDHNDVWSGIFAADSQLSKSRVIVCARHSRRSQGPARQRRTIFPRSASRRSWAVRLAPKPTKCAAPLPMRSRATGYWDRRFARDPSILGTKISIHQTPFEIVAVAPPGFFGETVGESPDLWVPLSMQDAIYPGVDLLATTPGVLDQRMWLQVMARRKPGVTVRQADANIAIVFRRMTELAIGTLSAQDRRQYGGQRLILRPGAQGASILRGAFAEPLRLLMALVGLVLLIACANVANLLLARGAAREKEFALRLAIGAGRGRAIRQLLAESLLLAVPGAIAGFLLAQWADSILLHMVSATRGREGAIQLNVHPDARMLLFDRGHRGTDQRPLRSGSRAAPHSSGFVGGSEVRPSFRQRRIGSPGASPLESSW